MNLGERVIHSFFFRKITGHKKKKRREINWSKKFDRHPCDEKVPPQGGFFGGGGGFFGENKKVESV